VVNSGVRDDSGVCCQIVLSTANQVFAAEFVFSAANHVFATEFVSSAANQGFAPVFVLSAANHGFGVEWCCRQRIRCSLPIFVVRSK
jgi:hypothetical protein